MDDFRIDEPLKIAVILFAVAGAIMVAVIEFLFVPFVRYLAKLRLKNKRTHTLFGLGNDDIANGAKPYHLLRQKWEANFIQNQHVKTNPNFVPMIFKD